MLSGVEADILVKRYKYRRRFHSESPSMLKDVVNNYFSSVMRLVSVMLPAVME